MSNTPQVFQSNQFNNNVPIKGDTCFVEGFNVLPVMIDPNSTNTLVPQDAVVLTTTDGVAIFVDKAADTDVPFGFILYDMQANIFSAGQACEIARYGTGIYAEADGSITRGDDLEYVPSSNVDMDPTMTVSGGINPISGVAIDNASNNDIFRFIIVTQVDFVPTIVGGSINNTPIGQSTPNLGTFTVLEATTSLEVTGPVVAETYSDDIVVLTPGATVSLDPTLGGLFQLTPASNVTLNAASVNTNHQRIVLEVLTSGSSSYTITFGANFKVSGTLATGTVTAKTFILVFECDGTNWVEASRTTAL